MFGQKEGGIIGLVLFALFTVIFVFIKVLSKKDVTHQEHLAKKDSETQSFLSNILESNREERRESLESNERSNDKLANALNELTGEIRKGRDRI